MKIHLKVKNKILLGSCAIICFAIGFLVGAAINDGDIITEPPSE